MSRTVEYAETAVAKPSTLSPARDRDRILGQIARGEVLAGPEAARRIAARHQEAYGAAVWGPAPDAAPRAAQKAAAA
ncbi:hypothetical protein ACFCYB_00470 [Streptomyces sp. NPDC056309]|uniref:hypothetical protein n=1 Tax=Streptomyces sp. NPDC056309 TaxID=3345781 RepID=UPI0035D8506A